MSDKLVTIDDYNELMQDHPRKFKPSDVGFRRSSPGEANCGGCLHFYRGHLRNVCEIMRPQNDEVPFDWVCQFQTIDRENFPYLEGHEPKEPEEKKD